MSRQLSFAILALAALAATTTLLWRMQCICPDGVTILAWDCDRNCDATYGLECNAVGDCTPLNW